MDIPEPAVKAVVTNVIFTCLSFFFVCFRLYTRAFMIKNIGADDYLILFSMMASIAFFATFMLQIKAGLGRPISLPELPAFLQALWATIPLYNLSLTLCKLSITVQCYRVLRTAPRLAKFLRIYLMILIIYGIWAVLSSIFNCWPVEYYWTWMAPIIEDMKQASAGKCMVKVALTFSNAAVNIATDFVLIFVPIPLLWRLQLPSTRQKVILVGVLSVTGGVAVVMSIVRLWSLYQMGIAPEGEENVHGVMIAIWSCIEINVAIVCACVPALRPLVGKVFPGWALGVGSTSRSRSGTAGERSRARSGMGIMGLGGSLSVGRRHGGGGTESDGWDLDGESGMGTRSNVRVGGSDFHLAGRASAGGHIQVEQTFEMKSVLVGHGARDVRGLYSGDEDEKGSRDGSEKNLVRG
ncbi:hypothetical protein QBC37DRAFT_300361 [Rhypophila decipiens]|uniref:Rhodopsin domain-containing protein n=1 Tax=Rhypophila decipiens TaxID=261697 RepID=A0AAN7B0Q6_9PEZI|nr:hypothetical protein QBC37DRAFT_300361 [Rhypophila decipiens]